MMSQPRDKLIGSMRALNLGINCPELCDYLLQDMVLSAVEYDGILTEERNAGLYAANRRLCRLMILKHPRQITRFLRRLQQIQPELAAAVNQRAAKEDSHDSENFTESDEYMAGAAEESAFPPSTAGYTTERERALRMEIEDLRQERQRHMQDICQLRDDCADRDRTISELTSSAFAWAPAAVKAQIRSKAKIRHADIYRNYDVALGKWEEKGLLPKGVRGCNACAADDYLYISVNRSPADGHSERELLRSPLTDLQRWQPCSLPLSRDAPWQQVKIFTDGEALFCAATLDRKNSVYSVYWQQASGDWSYVTALKQIRYSFRIAVAHGLLIVAGGKLSDGAECRTVDAYPLDSHGDPDTGRWACVATDTVYRSIPAVVCSGEQIHILGGTGADGRMTTQVSTLHRLATLSYRFQAASVPATPVAEFFATVANGFLVIAGGRSVVSAVGQCSFYDPAEGDWMELPPLCTAQSNPEMFMHRQRLYCLWGAVAKCEQPSRKIEVLVL